jgi:tetratricopeptide (TPR) repeat protein
MDFSNISVKKREQLPIDPIEIFHKAKISDPNINDLWLAQGDALREWHASRNIPDIGVVLNTGAGKTLVGLLIAQSLVNETHSQVLYACSSIQLVEQTAEKAIGYGLGVTTYFGGNFSNDLFLQGKAPCITTYQALFNGRSIFFRKEISAVIFDDAHAAEHLLRDHFSLQISRSNFPAQFSEIVELFRSYHRDIGKGLSYGELSDSISGTLFFIPPFVVQTHIHELQRILGAAGLAAGTNTMFAWEHLKDHIDVCCLLISSSSITITPPVVPVQTLPYFEKKTRRVFLSATLGASDAFARTFGKSPDLVISPATTAGECERMILMPSRLDSCVDDVELSKRLLAHRKSLIMVPTYARAEKWAGFANPPDKAHVTEAVNEFKANTASVKLLLAARYDGVDLPGDTCRIMVIDDLPMGVGPLERYLWEYLNLSNTFRTSIASRIVQSFGRISRGMSDHGVVVLTGDRLVQWILVPRNAAILPPFLQKQISLGYEVSEKAQTEADFSAAIDKMLNRDEGWCDAYADFLSNAEAEKNSDDNSVLTKLANNEAHYAVHMWNRDYENAIKCLRGSLDDAFNVSASTGAWHSLWLGYAYSLSGDNDSAEELYRRSHSAQRNIPPLPPMVNARDTQVFPSQVIEAAQLFIKRADSALGTPRNMETGLAHLDGSGSSGQTEEGLRVLGELLGMTSTRPDKEFGTGPDVLWLVEGLPALCIEVKTNKEPDSNYQKKEVGQLSDHIQWVKDNTTATEIIPVFVGPLRPATSTANPPNEYLVIGLEQFQQLGTRLTAALNDIACSALPLTLQVTVDEIFRERDLLWPKCFQNLESHILNEL